MLRPFARGGLLYEASTSWTHRIRFADDSLDPGSFSSRIDLPETAASLAAGIEIRASDRLSLRAEYNAELGSQWTSPAAIARIAHSL